ncbi:MAG: c-type cytochrome [Cyclobacteriaceae bacterium]
MKEKEVVEEEPASEAVVATADLEAGKSLFTTCIACHGDQGHGNKELGAPMLVNQEDWYIERQLANFQKGIRGADPKDERGKQMAAMAQTLVDEAAIKNVVGYIKSLSEAKPESTIEANIENGKQFYNAICGTCHGPKAKGNKSLNAPRLAGVDDWFLADQYKKFRDGIRGVHEEDTYGAQMKMMSTMLETDEAINDVMAYIQSIE